MTACPVEQPIRSRAEREAMLEEANGVIEATVKKSNLHPSHWEDAIQDATIAVWNATEKFDGTRGCKWSTFVVSVVKRILLATMRKAGAEGSACRPFLMSGSGDGSDFNFASDGRDGDNIPDREHASDDDEPDEDAVFGSMREAVRRQLGEPLLAKLTPKARQIVEMVSFEGLSPAQVADQLGLKVSIVKIVIQQASRTMLGQENHAPAIIAEHAERLLELRCEHPKATAEQIHRRLGVDSLTVGQVAKALQRIAKGERPEGQAEVARQRNRRDAEATHALIGEYAERIRELYRASRKTLRAELNAELGLTLTAKQVGALVERIRTGRPIAGTVEDYLAPKKS